MSLGNDAVKVSPASHSFVYPAVALVIQSHSLFKLPYPRGLIALRISFFLERCHFTAFSYTINNKSIRETKKIVEVKQKQIYKYE